jgi:sigma-B regulation protein RsbQ
MKQYIESRNNVRISGKGLKTLLFAHGFGCDQNVWRYVIPAFENEYNIVLFDYVGSGKSDLRAYDPQKYSTLKGYAQDVLDICDSLNSSDVIFIGHSVSGMIGALASIEKPDSMNHLIMLNPSPCYINDPPEYLGGFERCDLEEILELMEKNYLGWANFMAPVVMQTPERPELIQELEGNFCSTEPDIARRFARATFFADNRKDLPFIPIPSLIVQCSQDLIAPESVGHYLHRQIPNSDVHIMEVTGHCPHMSHPQETIQIIQNHLDALNL